MRVAGSWSRRRRAAAGWCCSRPSGPGPSSCRPSTTLRSRPPQPGSHPHLLVSCPSEAAGSRPSKAVGSRPSAAPGSPARAGGAGEEGCRRSKGGRGMGGGRGGSHEAGPGRRRWGARRRKRARSASSGAPQSRPCLALVTSLSRPVTSLPRPAHVPATHLSRPSHVPAAPPLSRPAKPLGPLHPARGPHRLPSASRRRVPVAPPPVAATRRSSW